MYKLDYVLTIIYLAVLYIWKGEVVDAYMAFTAIYNAILENIYNRMIYSMLDTVQLNAHWIFFKNGCLAKGDTNMF